MKRSDARWPETVAGLDMARIGHDVSGEMAKRVVCMERTRLLFCWRLKQVRSVRLARPPPKAGPSTTLVAAQDRNHAHGVRGNGVLAMQQQISVVTLGVADLARTRRFYAEGFGWLPVFENQ